MLGDPATGYGVTRNAEPPNTETSVMDATAAALGDSTRQHGLQLRLPFDDEVEQDGLGVLAQRRSPKASPRGTGPSRRRHAAGPDAAPPRHRGGRCAQPRLFDIDAEVSQE